MPTTLEQLHSRRTAVADEIAALTPTSDPDRKAALYRELESLEKRIAGLLGPGESEVVGL